MAAIATEAGGVGCCSTLQEVPTAHVLHTFTQLLGNVSTKFVRQPSLIYSNTSLTSHMEIRNEWSVRVKS